MSAVFTYFNSCIPWMYKQKGETCRLSGSLLNKTFQTWWWVDWKSISPTFCFQSMNSLLKLVMHLLTHFTLDGSWFYINLLIVIILQTEYLFFCFTFWITLNSIPGYQGNKPMWIPIYSWKWSANYYSSKGASMIVLFKSPSLYRKVYNFQGRHNINSFCLLPPGLISS